MENRRSAVQFSDNNVNRLSILTMITVKWMHMIIPFC